MISPRSFAEFTKPTRIRNLFSLDKKRMVRVQSIQFLSLGFLCAAIFASLCTGSKTLAQSGLPSSGQQSQAPQVQAFTPAPLDSGFGAFDPSRPVGISPKKIIRRFAAKESRFKRALDNYTYRRTVKLDTFDDEGKVDGHYLQVDDVIFSPSGRKQERVVYAPENTLTRIAMSPADFDDIEHRLPFTLTTEDIDRYQVTYIGKQRIDQVATYVFDVVPKQIDKGRRYFSGRIWVDARDFQIIVTNGKNIPDDTTRGQEDLSVPFTTYRQQIDGKYWFPVYTKAEGVLHFKNCKTCLPSDIPLREIVKYQDYKRFGTDIRILYNGLALEKEGSQPSAASSPSNVPQTASTRSTSRQRSEPTSSPPKALKE